MIVNSKVLEASAETVRSKGHPMPLTEGPMVSAEQLEAAARLLREAEPSVITSVRGAPSGATGEPQERPGFIESALQDDPDVLVFQVGILPADTYRIARDGTVQAT